MHAPWQLAAFFIFAAPLIAAAALDSTGPMTLDMDEGIVALRDVNVRGSVRIGLSPREVRDLVQAQIRFRATYVDRIETISRSAELDPCTVLGLLRALALKDLAADALPGRAKDLVETYRGNAETVKTLSDSSPEQAQERHRIQDLNLVGDVQGARDLLVKIGKGIVAGRDVKVGGDVIFGVPRADFVALIEDMRTQDAGHFDQLTRLSTDLNVNRCATASFLKSLGEANMPVADLHGRLQQIARQHLDLVAQWQSLTTRDPAVDALRDQAKAAIDRGDHATAATVLRQARDTLRAKVDQTRALSADYARVEADLGRLASIKLQYDEAAASFAEAHVFARRSGELVDAIRYKALEAAAYQDSGLYRKAEDAFLAALDMLDTMPRAGGAAATVVTRINLATLYYARSEYQEAQRHYKTALEDIDTFADRGAEERAERQAICFNGLAESALALNDFSAADVYFGRALNLMAGALGTDAPALAGVVTNLARLRTLQGHLSAAEALYARALELTASASGVSQVERAVTVNGLAALYFNTQRYGQAERQWNQVLDIYREALGKDHVITLGVLQNLAAVKRRQGDLAGAEDLYETALTVWEKALKRRDREASHFIVVSLFDGLGDVYVSQGRLDEAQSRYTQAVKLLRENLERPFGEGPLLGHPGPAQPSAVEQHLLMANLSNDLAVVYERKGAYEQTAESYRKARDIFALKLGTAHPDYGTATSNLARVLVRLGRPEEAEPLYLTAIEIAAANADELKVAYRNKLLGRLYRDQGRMAQARERLETAHAIYVRLLGPDAPRTRAVGDEMAALAPHANP